MANLQYDLLTEFSELADIEPSWRDLITRGHLSSVFQHPGWVDAWWRSFGDGLIPFVVVGRDEDSIIGIVPLMVDYVTKQAQFIGHPLNDRNGAVCAEGRLDALWSETVDLLASNGVTSAYFPDMLDADITALSSLRRPAVRLTPSLVSPIIELPRTWDEFLSGHDRRRVRGWRRDERRLAEVGAIKFECLTANDVTAGLMHEFHRDRINRWAFTGQLNLLAATERDDRFDRFLARLAQNLAPYGMLQLGRFHVGATVAAQNLYLVWPGVALNYMSTHQPKLRAYSPGTQATLAGIRHFISTDLPIFDFGRGDERYKFTLGARPRKLRGAKIDFSN